jgi:hypothetical protein
MQYLVMLCAANPNVPTSFCRITYSEQIVDVARIEGVDVFLGAATPMCSGSWLPRLLFTVQLEATIKRQLQAGVCHRGVVEDAFIL